MTLDDLELQKRSLA